MSADARVVSFGTGRGPVKSKYGNKRTHVDGHVFDSKREAKRYQDLILLENNGEVRGLERQVEYKLEINGLLICKYKADFRYELKTNGAWAEIVEDSKGLITPVYRLKRKLMKAIHGITILET